MYSGDYVPEKSFFSKKKCKSYLRQPEIYVEVKQRPAKATISSKVIDMGTAENSPITFSISTDIWFHISMHVAPEDVQTFALICRQTADLVKSKRFWRNLYERYCKKSKLSPWISELPCSLQSETITNNYGKQLIRANVIRALFFCHRPLKQRLKQGYNLNWLVRRTYVSAWQNECDGLWISWYKFWNESSVGNAHDSDDIKEVNDSDVVSNWELLATEHTKSSNESYSTKFHNPHEGISFLIVCCKSFTPFPIQLSYGNPESSFRLKATRELLCSDMRRVNLELDFLNKTNGDLITVKYPRIHMLKVFPWWHPQFHTFAK